MKKYFVILLAALILVCAVACNDSKTLGTLTIYTDGMDLTDATSAKLAFSTTSGTCYPVISLNFKDVQKGEVSVKLPAGVYEVVCIYLYDASEEQIEGNPFYIAGTSKNQIGSSDVVVVSEGETTYAKYLDPQ